MAGLEVRDLVVTYPAADGTTTAVAGVDLDVPVGQVVALLGPSGSGKSSLMRAVAGLEPVAAGSIRWDGGDVADQPVHRRGFGLVFQDGQLFPHRDVAGNVGYGLSGLPRRERARRVRDLLALVGLSGYERRPVTTLSGGQAQRVALARSLAPQPRLLLLDEPLSALDRSLREHLSGELREILRTTGTTAVYVTHDHDEAFAVADRVAVLDAGRLLQVAPPQELWWAPADETVAAFLGYGPFLAATVAGDRARTPLGEVPVPARLRGTSALRVALGPGALVVGDGGGHPATVVSGRFRRGRAEVAVELPDGQRAHALADTVPEPGATVRVHLQPDRAVIVPARGRVPAPAPQPVRPG